MGVAPSPQTSKFLKLFRLYNSSCCFSVSFKAHNLCLCSPSFSSLRESYPLFENYEATWGRISAGSGPSSCYLTLPSNRRGKMVCFLGREGRIKVLVWKDRRQEFRCAYLKEKQLSKRKLRTCKKLTLRNIVQKSFFCFPLLACNPSVKSEITYSPKCMHMHSPTEIHAFGILMCHFWYNDLPEL